MPIIYLLKTALTGLKTNKSRAVLTILGIVIGIASIIMILALGKGAEAMIMNQLNSFGSTTISLEPGKQPEGPSDMASIFTDSLKIRDLEALQKKSNVQNIDLFVPLVILSDNVIYKQEMERGDIYGTSPSIMDFYNKITPDDGIMFTEENVKNMDHVVVIGWEIKDKLFGMSSAVGEKVKIKDQWFRVVGTFPKKGKVSMQNIDKLVLLPYTTHQKYLTGTDYFQSIILRAKSDKVLKEATAEIKATIREQHKITDPDKDDFRVQTMEDAAKTIGTIMGVITLLLSAVAAIALVVGGIGIMNIMLVSVSERTREIGLRKALGATSSDIKNQFLFESIILTGIGGVFGILIGVGMSSIITYGINTFTEYDWVFVFPISGAIIGIAVSTIVGLIFGIYPAKQAAKKSPIEALRYE